MRKSFNLEFETYWSVYLEAGVLFVVAIVAQIWPGLVTGDPAVFATGVFLFAAFICVDFGIKLKKSHKLLEDVHKHQLQTPHNAGAFFKTFKTEEIVEDFVYQIREANEVKICAPCPVFILEEYMHELKNILKRRGHIVLILPIGRAEEMANERTIQAEQDRRQAEIAKLPVLIQELRDHEKSLHDKFRHHKGQFTVRKIDYWPSCIMTLTRVSGQSDAGDMVKIFVSINNYGQSDDKRPALVVDKRDGDVFNAFKNDLENLYQKSTT